MATVFSISSYLTCLITSKSLIMAPFIAHDVLTKLQDILGVHSLHVTVATFHQSNSICNFGQPNQVSHQHIDTIFMIYDEFTLLHSVLEDKNYFCISHCMDVILFMVASNFLFAMVLEKPLEIISYNTS